MIFGAGAYGAGIYADGADGGGEPPTSTSGGLIFGGLPRRRRYVVKHGRAILVFGTEQAAIAAQEAIDKARTIKTEARKASADKSNRAQRRSSREAVTAATAIVQGALADHPPLDAFALDQAAELARAMGEIQALHRMRSMHDLEAVAALWQQMRDEEDDIACLMELM